MRWGSALLFAWLMCLASLFASPSLHAKPPPTYEFVLQVDFDKVAERSGGPLDLDTGMERAIAVVRARLGGLAPPPKLTHEGNGRLIVQIAHPDAPRIIRDVFGITGDLEFLVVDLETTPADIARGRPRPGSAIYPMKNGDPPIAVRLDGGISGDRLVSAMASIDADTGQSVVQLQFDAKGAQALADFTGANVGRPIAIVLDGEVLSAPTVQEAIRSGAMQISGSLSRDEANQLAIALRSGALPTDFILVSEQVVEPGPQN